MWVSDGFQVVSAPRFRQSVTKIGVFVHCLMGGMEEKTREERRFALTTGDWYGSCLCGGAC